MDLLLVIIFGAIIGSFLSVCIYRIPLGRESGLTGLLGEDEETEDELEDEDDIAPHPLGDQKITISEPKRSFCTSCGKTLAWWHNIPIISWFLLRGRCSYCEARISFRYPLVELLSAGNAYLSFTMFPLPTAVVVFTFVSMLIVISFIDIDYYIIPNVITYPGFLICVLLAAINHFIPTFTPPVVDGLMSCLFGILGGAGVLLLISEIYTFLRKKQGLGLGDVKLLALTGALFGAEASIYTIFIGSLVGSVAGIALLILSRLTNGRWNLTYYLPFGPYLAVANALYIFTGSKYLVALNKGVSDVFLAVAS